jgi:hypothetical protein
VCIHVGWFEQPDLVVMPQHLRADVGGTGRSCRWSAPVSSWH